MRINYWSLGFFARWLRVVFGLPKSPYSLSSDGWDRFHELERSKSKFGIWLIEHLDTLQDVVLWIPDKIQNIGYWISNVRYGAHRLPTLNKLGTWNDLTSKIPDSLMLSIIQYVEEECFRARLIWDDDLPPDVLKFRDQGFFGRLFNPIKISDEVRAKLGIEWMESQIAYHCTTRRQRERHGYTRLQAAYHYAKNEYFVDVWDQFILERVDGKGVRYSTDYNTIRAAEVAKEKEVIKYCQIIIFHHEHLWS